MFFYEKFDKVDITISSIPTKGKSWTLNIKILLAKLKKCVRDNSLFINLKILFSEILSVINRRFLSEVLRLT